MTSNEALESLLEEPPLPLFYGLLIRLLRPIFLIFEILGCNGNNHIYMEPGMECTAVNSRQCHGLYILVKVFFAQIHLV